MGKITTSTILLIALSIVSAASASANPPALAVMDWSANAPHNLTATPPSEQTTETLVAALFQDPHMVACSSRFVDLRRSKNLSWVVAVSDGRFCDGYIIDKTPSGFEMYSYNLTQGANGPTIKDLGGDGHLELIVPTDFTSYDGAQHCVAERPVIYAWTGTTYSDVSDRYRSYYERQLASRKKQIAAIEAQREQAEQSAAAPTPAVGGTSPENALPTPTFESQSSGPFPAGVGLMPTPSPSPAPPPAAPEPDRLGLDCDKAEAAKIERFLGISRDAGMSDAIKWADSDNPDDRQFAAEIFADIGTPQALEYLKTLSHDPIHVVAMYAKSGLARLKQGPVAHAVDEQAIPLSALDTHR